MTMNDNLTPEQMIESLNRMKMTPEEYLEMLKEMSYDELIEETCTDDIYHISEFMEAWG